MGNRVPYFGVQPFNPFIDEATYMPSSGSPPYYGVGSFNPLGFTADQFLKYLYRCNSLNVYLSFTQDFDDGVSVTGSGSFEYSTTWNLVDMDEIGHLERIGNPNPPNTGHVWDDTATGPVFSAPNLGSWAYSVDGVPTDSGYYYLQYVFECLFIGTAFDFSNNQTVNYPTLMTLLVGGDFESGSYYPHMQLGCSVGMWSFTYGDLGLLGSYLTNPGGGDIVSGTLNFTDESLSTNLYTYEESSGIGITINFSGNSYWAYSTTTGLPVWDTSTGAQLNDPFS